MSNLEKTYQKILDFLKKNESNEYLSIKLIQDNVGLDHPQKVIHRLQQLEKKGYIRKQDNWVYQVFENPVKDTIELPVYWSALCGNKGSAVVEEYTAEKIKFSSSFLWVSDEENYFFVRAKWDSMEPQISSWDLLLIRKWSGGFSDWDKLFVIHEWKPKIKKVIKSGLKYFLVSLNKNHEDIEILSTDDIEVIGIVKKVIKDF
jgi:repressor LexA